jgi:hypothetical protein
MRVLEARFHPQDSGEGDFIVVAHVVWEKDVSVDAPRVQPAASLIDTGSPATMLAKLHFLIVNSAPETFARLQALRSKFWSFVEVAPSTKLRPAAYQR